MSENSYKLSLNAMTIILNEFVHLKLKSIWKYMKLSVKHYVYYNYEVSLSSIIDELNKVCWKKSYLTGSRKLAFPPTIIPLLLQNYDVADVQRQFEPWVSRIFCHTTISFRWGRLVHCVGGCVETAWLPVLGFELSILKILRSAWRSRQVDAVSFLSSSFRVHPKIDYEVITILNQNAFNLHW